MSNVLSAIQGSRDPQFIYVISAVTTVMPIGADAPLFDIPEEFFMTTGRVSGLGRSLRTEGWLRVFCPGFDSAIVSWG